MQGLDATRVSNCGAGHDNIKENSAHIFRYLPFVNRSGTQPMKMLAALAAAKVSSVRGWCIRVAMK